MATKSDDIDPVAARESAARLFEIAFPLFLVDAVRRAHPIASRQFQLLMEGGSAFAPGLEEDDELVVICSAWIDLSQPMLMCLPHVHGRHFSMTLFDTAGEPFAAMGARTGDDTGLGVALVGPRWTGQVRHGVRAIRATSEACWAVSRVHAHSLLDRPEAVTIARRLLLAPLDAEVRRDETLVVELGPPFAACLRQTADMSPDVFFHRLDAVFERAPIAFQQAHRRELVEHKARIGGPGPAEEWGEALTDALTRGCTAGLSRIRAAAGADRELPDEGWRTLGASAVE
ncbi:MAG: DUF1254 domain-containing protein, partial [Phenylobacterium sp.]